MILMEITWNKLFKTMLMFLKIGFFITTYNSYDVFIPIFYKVFVNKRFLYVHIIIKLKYIVRSIGIYFAEIVHL